MNGKPSHALLFFEEIKEKGAPFLKSLVNSNPPTFETEWLDFKGAERITDKEIKETWSKSLSGFANTEGGVLVWGIDARKDRENQIDCASDFSLVKNPATFESRLRELHSQSTNPPVQGVDFWHGTYDQGSDIGFVVSYIPESRFKPHRAESANQNFYIRVGDSFRIPNVSLLRSMFFPETHSLLIPELKVQGDGRVFWIDGFLHNQGVSSARDIVLFVNHKSNIQWKFESAVGWQRAGITHPKLKKGSGVICPLPIHPGTALPAFSFHVTEENIRTRGIEFISFEIFIFCDDNMPIASKITFSQENIDDKETKFGKTEIVEIEKIGF